MLVVLVGLVVAAPFIAIAAFKKQGRLREEFERFKSEAEGQRKAAQREMAELRRQIAEAAKPHVAAGEKSKISEPAIKEAVPEVVEHRPFAAAPIPQVAPQKPAIQPQEPAKLVVPTPPPAVPVIEEKLEPVVAKVLEVTIPIPTQVTTPVSVPSPPMAMKPAAPKVEPPQVPPVTPKTEIPAAAKTSEEIKLSEPARTTPHVEVPPAAATRVSSSAPTAAFRVPAPKPTFQQRMKTVSAIEETLGSNWLQKIGIIILVIGIAMFGVYELSTVGALGKVAISYLASIFLLAGGIFLEKRERYRLVGRPCIGGAWALLFFSTFALYHVEAMRVFPRGAASQTIDCALMLIVAVAMAMHTLRYRSQLVTGLAFLLGFTTVALSQDTVYSLSAGLFLAIALVAIVQKMDWFELEVFGILSSYLNHLYWLYRILGIDGAQGHPFEAYHASVAMLFFYWLTFRVSYVIRTVKTEFQERVSTTAAILNMFLLLGVMKFQSVQPKLAYIALLVLGALEFAFGQLPITKRRREAFVVLSLAGAALMIASPFAHYAYRDIVPLLWLIAAEIFLAAGIIVKEVVFRRIGLGIGILVALFLAAVNFRHLMAARADGEGPLLEAGVFFGLCGAVFYLNSLGVAERWKEYFSDRPESAILVWHSYAGGFAAASAVWALFTHDWTAVAFAGAMLALAALCRRAASKHVQVQYALFGVAALYRAVVFNVHLESAARSHLTSRLITLPILAAVFYLTAKLAALRDDREQRVFRGIFAAAGTALFGALIWYEVPELWQPLAFIACAVILSEAGRVLSYGALSWHAHGLTPAAVFCAVTAELPAPAVWHTIPLRVLSSLPVVAGCYWLAKRIGVEDETHLRIARNGYTWVAAFVVGFLIWSEAPAPWMAVYFMAAGVALALAGRRWNLAHLGYQEHVFAIAAVAQLWDTNYQLTKYYGHFSLRMITVSMVAAGLYGISRKAAAPHAPHALSSAYLHTTTATTLLAALMWYEVTHIGWLAALWALFAFVLAVIDRRFKMDDLRWQAHALSASTLLRCITVNLYLQETWRDISVRLLSLSIVAVIFYAMSRIVRMPEEWRGRDFHHIYSWSASALVSLTIWYELQTQPLAIAVAWAAFGLVLFEYGLLRKVPQFRFQSYLVLVFSFARIFYSNLNVGERGEFLGPRLYTIVPLVLIFYFVYAQLSVEEFPEEKKISARTGISVPFDAILAYLGTAALAALLYFQVSFEWVVTSYAVLSFVLLGAALALNRPIFLHQGLLVTLGVLARGMAHNLYGGSYFTDGDWVGRYFILGTAEIILLASLFFAFRLRNRLDPPPNANPLFKPFMYVARRPEQMQFFVAFLLLTFMLAKKMPGGYLTIGWGLEGVLIFMFALAVKERSFRLTGLGMLLLCVGKVMAMDVWGLQTRDRYLTLIIVGSALIGVSVLYNRYRESIRQYL
jgi:hypothetical protein